MFVRLPTNQDETTNSPQLFPSEYEFVIQPKTVLGIQETRSADQISKLPGVKYAVSTLLSQAETSATRNVEVVLVEEERIGFSILSTNSEGLAPLENNNERFHGFIVRIESREGGVLWVQYLKESKVGDEGSELDEAVSEKNAAYIHYSPPYQSPSSAGLQVVYPPQPGVRMSSAKDFGKLLKTYFQLVESRNIPVADIVVAANANIEMQNFIKKRFNPKQFNIDRQDFLVIDFEEFMSSLKASRIRSVFERKEVKEKGTELSELEAATVLEKYPSLAMVSHFSNVEKFRLFRMEESGSIGVVVHGHNKIDYEYILTETDSRHGNLQVAHCKIINSVNGKEIIITDLLEGLDWESWYIPAENDEGIDYKTTQDLLVYIRNKDLTSEQKQYIEALLFAPAFSSFKSNYFCIPLIVDDVSLTTFAHEIGHSANREEQLERNKAINVRRPPDSITEYISPKRFGLDLPPKMITPDKLAAVATIIDELRAIDNEKTILSRIVEILDLNNKDSFIKKCERCRLLSLQTYARYLERRTQRPASQVVSALGQIPASSQSILALFDDILTEKIPGYKRTFS